MGFNHAVRAGRKSSLVAVVAVAVLGGCVVSAPASANADGAADVWGACGWRDGEMELVRTFDRHRGDDGAGHVLTGGGARMLCGDDRSGYRHILKRHKRDWAYDAGTVGSNWRDHADWSIDVTLTDPDAVSYRVEPNDKRSYCYSRSIELWDKNNRKHIKNRIVKVVVKEETADIITAYPNDRQCSN